MNTAASATIGAASATVFKVGFKGYETIANRNIRPPKFYSPDQYIIDNASQIGKFEALSKARLYGAEANVMAVRLEDSVKVLDNAGYVYGQGRPGDWMIMGASGSKNFFRDEVFRQAYVSADEIGKAALATQPSPSSPYPWKLDQVIAREDLPTFSGRRVNRIIPYEGTPTGTSVTKNGAVAITQSQASASTLAKPVRTGQTLINALEAQAIRMGMPENGYIMYGIQALDNPIEITELARHYYSKTPGALSEIDDMIAEKWIPEKTRHLWREAVDNIRTASAKPD
ncbi:MAG: hypothetical protein K2Z81_05620 [Cyanobacteria bacterium]|nr:hypothetical protein [Cyanobacteriota bacterium]